MKHNLFIFIGIWLVFLSVFPIRNGYANIKLKNNNLLSQEGREKSNDATFYRAQDYLKNGFYDKAIASFKEFLSTNPSLNKKKRSYIGLATCYVEKGNKDTLAERRETNYSQAKVYFCRALEFGKETDPLNISIYSSLAFIYKQLKDYNQAIGYYKKGLDLSLSQKEHIKIIPIYLALAECYKQLKDYKQARVYLREGFLYISKKHDANYQ